MTALPIPVEELVLAGCAHKDPLTRQQAKAIVDRMNWARKSKHATNAYRCDHCGAWHVGAKARR
jgi:hypothetical protein